MPNRRHGPASAFSSSPRQATGWGTHPFEESDDEHADVSVRKRARAHQALPSAVATPSPVPTRKPKPTRGTMSQVGLAIAWTTGIFAIMIFVSLIVPVMLSAFTPRRVSTHQFRPYAKDASYIMRDATPTPFYASPQFE